VPLSRQFQERIAGSHPFQLMDEVVACVLRPIEEPRPALSFVGAAENLDDVGTVHRYCGQQRGLVLPGPEVSFQDETVAAGQQFPR